MAEQEAFGILLQLVEALECGASELGQTQEALARFISKRPSLLGTRDAETGETLIMRCARAAPSVSLLDALRLGRTDPVRGPVSAEVTSEWLAAVNLRDKNGRTALHHTFEERFVDEDVTRAKRRACSVATYLVRTGSADPKVRDRTGRTALEHADALPTGTKLVDDPTRVLLGGRVDKPGLCGSLAKCFGGGGQGATPARASLTSAGGTAVLDDTSYRFDESPLTEEMLARMTPEEAEAALDAEEERLHRAYIREMKKILA